MRTLVYLFLSISTLFSCNQQPQNNAGPSADAKFQKLADNYISGFLAWRPTYGVALGYHQYDGKTTNLSSSSIGEERARLNKFDQQLKNIDTASLSPKTFYDYRILQSAIKQELFNFDDLDIYHKNPMTYAGALDLSIYVKRNFASMEDRLKSIIAIEKMAPQLFEAARLNLRDSLPKPFIDLSIQISRGTAAFLNGDLKVALKDIKNDTLLKTFDRSNQIAVEALNSFATWLEKEKLSKANNKYAIGEENYKKMLLYNEGITLSPEKALALGLRQLKLEQQTFKNAAKIINPNKNPLEVYRDLQKEHPTAENLIPEVKKDVETTQIHYGQ